MSESSQRKRDAEAEALKERGENVVNLAADIYVSMCGNTSMLDGDGQMIDVIPAPRLAFDAAEAFMTEAETYIAEITAQAVEVRNGTEPEAQP